MDDDHQDSIPSAIVDVTTAASLTKLAMAADLAPTGTQRNAVHLEWIKHDITNGDKLHIQICADSPCNHVVPTHMTICAL